MKKRVTFSRWEDLKKKHMSPERITRAKKAARETKVTVSMRCRFCGKATTCSAAVYAENPFCNACFDERVAAAQAARETKVTCSMFTGEWTNNPPVLKDGEFAVGYNKWGGPFTYYWKPGCEQPRKLDSYMWWSIPFQPPVEAKKPPAKRSPSQGRPRPAKKPHSRSRRADR